MDFSTKVDIGKLVGQENWCTWKYKITIMLEGTEGAYEAVQGLLQKPVLAPEAGDAAAAAVAVSAYNAALAKYKKTESCALLILTTNMTEDTLKKVMRYRTAREVWQELHRLFDGQGEDKAYSLCLEFFGMKRNNEDDIPTLMSKLKNVWTDLKVEINKLDPTAKLPELFLICKVLDTLDERYFNFKSSWLMLKQNEKTIDNLTSHLCTFERDLGGQGSAPQQEALVTTPAKRRIKKDEHITCGYCSGKGHRVRKCYKWIKDGRPPKPSSTNSPGSSSSQSNKHVQQISLYIDAYTLGETRDLDNWYVDSGATTHIAVKRRMFTNFKEFEDDHTVTTADGTTIPALGKGTVVVESTVNGNKEHITLNDVWLVPTLTKNLFSTLAAQDRMPNSIFISTTKECKLNIDGATKVVGKRLPCGGLYKLCFVTVPPKHNTAIEVNALTGNNMLQLYHERFAHQDKSHVIRVVKRELGIALKQDKVKCEGCIFGKAHRKPFGIRDRATKAGELMHADVCGPFATQSISKCKYFVLFKDDYSSYRFVYFIKEKSEVKDKLKQMLEEARNAGHSIKTLLTDNGGEFDNEAVRKILQSYGIQQRLTMPYTPEQNGCSERENRTLVEAARCMMYARGELPQKLWAELINTAAYVLNRTGPTKVEGKVPYELWHGKKPKISHLRIIGSICYAHIPKQCRKKMSKKAIKGLLIGYEIDGYRIWDGIKTVRSRDVTFESDVEFRISTSTSPEGEDIDVERINPGLAPSEIEPEPNVEREEFELIDNFVDAEDVEVEEPTIVNQPETEHRYNLRDRSTLSRPVRLNDYICHIESEPETYQEAINRPDRVQWQKAMQSELKSLEDNNVWNLCELPSGRKALPCKWVFRIKYNPDGTIEKYKARLVVKGFKQRKGIDYDQTFSPVARMATIRALLSVSAQEKLYLTQFDVSTAFLNGKLQEEIYMQQPDGFSDGTSKVCRLQRSLYGLKQAPRCWNTCFEDLLLQKGFVQCTADCCLFTKQVGNKKILITLYVDDGLVATTDKNLADQFLQELGKSLKITSKVVSYYLGLELQQYKDGSIFINQESYTKRILDRFGMADCNPVTTPIDKTSETGKVVDGVPEKKFPYREAVGALAYLMTGTRPDIAYAVGVASRKLENPTEADWLKVKRIFRYLKGTISYGIKYQSSHPQTCINGYSDADHAGDEQTGRSTTGVVCLYAGGAVSWLSQRQASVAISTTEAEIVAASEGARELVWLQRIFNELMNMDVVPILYVDNEAAIKLAHNPEFHKRTKHIRVRHFFVRECVQEGLVDVRKTCSTDQLADILTKGVPRPRLQDLRAILGISTSEGKC